MPISKMGPCLGFSAFSPDDEFWFLSYLDHSLYDLKSIKLSLVSISSKLTWT
jgi:hypothetical protein